MTWDQFTSKAVTREIREREARKNIFVPFSRWVALREAYVLHHLGVTGNMVSLFRVVLAVTALLCFARFASGDLAYSIVGIALMTWQLNLDAVDGALARAQDKTSDFGNALDNLGIDFARSSFWILVGAMTGDIRMVVLGALAGYLLVPFRQYQAGESVGRFDDFARLFVYIPVLWLIVPSLMLAVHVLGVPPEAVAYVVTWFYFGLAVVWFSVCLWKNLVYPNT